MTLEELLAEIESGILTNPRIAAERAYRLGHERAAEIVMDAVKRIRTETKVVK